MPDWTLVNRSHVLAAVEECDRLGSREFLSRYRFGRSTAYTLWHRGEEYDSTAILGVAYLLATGRTATRDELGGGASSNVKVLQGLGFDVVVDEEELEREERKHAARSVGAASPKPRSARSAPAAKRAKPPPRAKPAPAAIRLCPTCHMALPVTGVCDFCD
jgi:hypothetical protein